jgi:hypothetical protein
MAPPGRELRSAGFTLAQLLQAGRAVEQLVCGFEINIVATHKVSLRVTNQPVSGVHVQYAALRGNLRGLLGLNRIHQERFDCSVQHICLGLRACLPLNIRLESEKGIDKGHVNCL